ncbi:hypothetical protein N7530_004980 [Penicillium desertorum]|uniref:Uncharacterized protein n=1 Tax=Penicillium desertorum TaxID=1303715 RepID=A0A9W9WZ96_9EURO|nr:hypothetical protein N7530_004980 [Penicillium desertorum]
MDFGFPLQILQDEYESCPSMTVDVKDAQGVYNINMPILQEIQEILDNHGHHGLLLLEAPTALYAIFRGAQTLHWQYSGAHLPSRRFDHLFDLSELKGKETSRATASPRPNYVTGLPRTKKGFDAVAIYTCKSTKRIGSTPGKKTWKAYDWATAVLYDLQKGDWGIPVVWV